MSTASSIKALHHEDIRQALLKLNKSSSEKKQEVLEARLEDEALKEQSDGFDVECTYHILNNNSINTIVSLFIN
jgi:hypothetical protein